MEPPSQQRRWTPNKFFFSYNEFSLLQKADVVTGLSEGQAENAQSQDEKWLINGEWGVIQSCFVKM